MTAAPVSFADAQQPNGDQPILSVRNLRAHFRTSHFGINRYVKAVDDITFDVKRGEIYGLAGESSSGKTTLIKTIAGAIKPPSSRRWKWSEAPWNSRSWLATGDCIARRLPKWRAFAGGICPTSCRAR
jgi:ABC-type glutathione transport system ATPase component